MVAKHLVNDSQEFGTGGHVGNYTLADVRTRMIFGVSTGTLSDDLAKAIEPGTALVSKRLESLHWLQDNGFRTYGMTCPSLPYDSVDAYAAFAEDMARALRPEKCEHVWAEVMNVRGDQLDNTVAALQDAEYIKKAHMLQIVTDEPTMWERYSRATFEAHAKVYEGMTGPDGKPKLRFLQYVTKATRPYWFAQVERGAVCL
jgi:DNA repair photolyase